jgi:hypothetical protein
MYDPFIDHDPPVLVHEVDGPDFESAWQAFEAPNSGLVCPLCAAGDPQDRGVSPRKGRQWIRFSCGDVIAQEITAG